MQKNHIVVSGVAANQPLSKLQKQFNNYLKKIQKLKSDIVQAQVINDYIRKKLTTDILPVETKLIELRKEWLYKLDWAFDNLKLPQRDKDALSDIIQEHAFQNLEYSEDDALKALYEKHSDSTFEEDSQHANDKVADLMKSMFENMYGIEFDDDVDVSDPIKFQAYVAEKMGKMQEEEAERQANRKKTQKQIEKEEKKQVEADSISKSVREIYTNLVKEFHPDLEQDETERERKTGIMQRITAAKDANDLVELLRLQLEYEQIDQSKINQLADNQLKNYNKILKEQVSTLEAELFEHEGGMDFNDPLVKFRHEKMYIIDLKIEQSVKETKKTLKALTNEMEQLRDVNFVKLMVKEYRKFHKQQERGGFGMFEF